MSWPWIIAIALVSFSFWQLMEATVSQETLKKLHRGAATLFWWMVAIFVIGGVIGLLNFGWKHL